MKEKILKLFDIVDSISDITVQRQLKISYELACNELVELEEANIIEYGKVEKYRYNLVKK